MRWLFIGNSFTYVNNLPLSFTRACQTAFTSPPIFVAMLARGGATLEDHYKNPALEGVLAEKNWDVVVLQEQSTRPLIMKNKFLRYAELLDEMIKKVGAQTCLYIPPVPKKLQSRQPKLSAAYLQCAQKLNALIAPVGPVLYRIQADKPSMHIHHDDGIHPTPMASYIAAWVFYLTLFADKHPLQLSREIYTTQYGTPHEGATVRLPDIPLEEADYVYQATKKAVDDFWVENNSLRAK